VRRLAQRSEPHVKVFNLNYDPLVEWAAEQERVRLYDGFTGHEHAYFDPPLFEEEIGRIRGQFRAKTFERTAKPIHLLKLHGSVGSYDCPTKRVRRCGLGRCLPTSTEGLMTAPPKRKANDTMARPYAALWSAFRGALAQDS